ncbi:MAG: hypothetical protein GWN84_12940 [Gammaproteobacteria bacterium]|nr:hypothetical protein [Gammaproteobacteria bacterium]NIR83766.1 hypothetical protein [Gammaproteobacteria bacterium]NIR88124.1 hypothetical protein [Gammaproteobacteria bacterium]NIU05083.1 hypothetical protein [Gammaproteobacteria bacterium]NIV51926.1 hypothetical protein [Gammaproteobacteria bacterium]
MGGATLFYWMAGVVGVAGIGVALWVWRKVAGLRLRHPGLELAKCEQMPEPVRTLLAPAEDKLRPFGFEPAFCIREKDSLSDEEWRWKRVCANARERIYATVAPTNHPAEKPGCEVTFATIYADGTLLLTVNGRRHLVLWDIPRAVVIDPYADRLEDQYAAHRAEAIDSDTISERVATSPAVYKSRLQLAYDTYIDVLAESAWIRKRRDGDYDIRLRPALRFARQIREGERRRTAARANADLSARPHGVGARRVEEPVERVV